jgi:hypothetical protein
VIFESAKITSRLVAEDFGVEGAWEPAGEPDAATPWPAASRKMAKAS